MKYLLTGLYPPEGGQMQRWSDTYEADTPNDAESQARFEYPDVIIAGVVCLGLKNDGKYVEVEIVVVDTNSHSPAPG